MAEAHAQIFRMESIELLRSQSCITFIYEAINPCDLDAFDRVLQAPLEYPQGAKSGIKVHKVLLYREFPECKLDISIGLRRSWSSYD